jgi:hypothetical protein
MNLLVLQELARKEQLTFSLLSSAKLTPDTEFFETNVIGRLGADLGE